ncbi:MAG TPA: alpha/beta hydrolase [Dermatophilaceae bacterium]|nr:alpha/beta hydrolase [Dermatophilaceae bacterium]
MTTRTWQFAWTSEPERPAAAVLVLHGGQERSRHRARWRHVAALRMVPFARAVAAGGQGQVAVARLLHTVRGWNGDEASPVADAREALAELRSRHPGIPLGLLGHSMGGRTALHVADEPGVAVVVGLAPWVARGDLPRGGPGLRVLLMHGTRDRITSPKATRWMARELGTLGVDVTWRPIPGAGHALLRFARRWHREAAAFLVQGLLGPPPERRDAEGTTSRDPEPDPTNCA